LATRQDCYISFSKNSERGRATMLPPEIDKLLVRLGI